MMARDLVFIFLASLLAVLSILFAPPWVGLGLLAGIAVFWLFSRFPHAFMICFGIFMVFQRYLSDQFQRGSVAAELINRLEEALILILSVFVLVRFAFFSKKLKYSPITLPLALLVFLAFMGTVCSRLVPMITAFSDLFLLLKGFLVFYIFYNIAPSLKDLQKYVQWFFAAALLVLFLGVLDFIAPHAFRSLIHNDTPVDVRFGLPSAVAIFTHPGMFGWFMAFCASFCIAYFIILNKKRYLVFALCFIFGSIMSMRFKPILGFCAIGVAVFLMVRSSQKIKFFLACLFLAAFCVTLAGPKIQDLWTDKIQNYISGPRAEIQPRNILYATGLKVAEDYFPLGSGLGTFGGWIARVHYSPLYHRYNLDRLQGFTEEDPAFLTDTFWPYILAQFGFGGLFLYVFIIFLLCRELYRFFESAGNPYLQAFAFGVILALIEGVFESTAMPIFVSPPHYFLIFAVLGLALSFKGRHIKQEGVYVQK